MFMSRVTAQKRTFFLFALNQKYIRRSQREKITYL